jgi:hypothetical protein
MSKANPKLNHETLYSRVMDIHREYDEMVMELMTTRNLLAQIADGTVKATDVDFGLLVKNIDALQAFKPTGR